MDPGPFDLSKVYVHLGLGATAVPLPDFGWDEDSLTRYDAAHEADGDEGRLVFIGTVSSDWTHWECHPVGDELVVSLEGRSTLIQTCDGAEVKFPMGAGDTVVNPRGTWHTLDVHEPGRALYVTPGRGTLHRPR